MPHQYAKPKFWGKSNAPLSGLKTQRTQKRVETLSSFNFRNQLEQQAARALSAGAIYDLLTTCETQFVPRAGVR